MEQLLNFGEALLQLIKGKKLARRGWNGKGMFVYHVPAAKYPAMTDIAKEMGEEIEYGAYLAMKTVDGTVVVWSIDTTSALAEDWYIVD